VLIHVVRRLGSVSPRAGEAGPKRLQIEVYRVPLLCKSLALSHLGIWFVRWSSRVFLTKPLPADLHRGAYFWPDTESLGRLGSLMAARVGAKCMQEQSQQEAVHSSIPRMQT
jgi:hypothetical protein